MVLQLTATGVAERPADNLKSAGGMSSPGGEDTGEGELNPRRSRGDEALTSSGHARQLTFQIVLLAASIVYRKSKILQNPFIQGRFMRIHSHSWPFMPIQDSPGGTLNRGLSGLHKNYKYLEMNILYICALLKTSSKIPRKMTQKIYIFRIKKRGYVAL